MHDTITRIIADDRFATLRREAADDRLARTAPRRRPGGVRRLAWLSTSLGSRLPGRAGITPSRDSKPSGDAVPAGPRP
ncbi:hypothetical protein BH23CHL8_BH23CHL8_29840 [soil metagenome]